MRFLVSFIAAASVYAAEDSDDLVVQPSEPLLTTTDESPATLGTATSTAVPSGSFLSGWHRRLFNVEYSSTDLEDVEIDFSVHNVNAVSISADDGDDYGSDGDDDGDDGYGNTDSDGDDSDPSTDGSSSEEDFTLTITDSFSDYSTAFSFSSVFPVSETTIGTADELLAIIGSLTPSVLAVSEPTVVIESPLPLLASPTQSSHVAATPRLGATASPAASSFFSTVDISLGVTVIEPTPLHTVKPLSPLTFSGQSSPATSASSIGEPSSDISSLSYGDATMVTFPSAIATPFEGPYANFYENSRYPPYQAPLPGLRDNARVAPNIPYVGVASPYSDSFHNFVTNQPGIGSSSPEVQVDVLQKRSSDGSDLGGSDGRLGSFASDQVFLPNDTGSSVSDNAGGDYFVTYEKRGVLSGNPSYGGYSPPSGGNLRRRSILDCLSGLFCPRGRSRSSVPGSGSGAYYYPPQPVYYQPQPAYQQYSYVQAPPQQLPYYYIPPDSGPTVAAPSPSYYYYTVPAQAAPSDGTSGSYPPSYGNNPSDQGNSAPFSYGNVPTSDNGAPVYGTAPVYATDYSGSPPVATSTPYYVPTSAQSASYSVPPSVATSPSASTATYPPSDSNPNDGSNPGYGDPVYGNDPSYATDTSYANPSYMISSYAAQPTVTYVTPDTSDQGTPLGYAPQSTVTYVTPDTSDQGTPLGYAPQSTVTYVTPDTSDQGTPLGYAPQSTVTYVTPDTSDQGTPLGYAPQSTVTYVTPETSDQGAPLGYAPQSTVTYVTPETSDQGTPLSYAPLPTDQPASQESSSYPPGPYSPSDGSNGQPDSGQNQQGQSNGQSVNSGDNPGSQAVAFVSQVQPPAVAGRYVDGQAVVQPFGPPSVQPIVQPNNQLAGRPAYRGQSPVQVPYTNQFLVPQMYKPVVQGPSQLYEVDQPQELLWAPVSPARIDSRPGLHPKLTPAGPEKPLLNVFASNN